MHEDALPQPRPVLIHGEVPELLVLEPVGVDYGPATQPNKTKERLLTTLALGALGAVASYAEYRGLMHGWAEPLTAFRDSGRHPLVGYIGAAIASRHSKLRGVGAALAAGTVADIGTEASQAFLLSGPDQTLSFLAHSQLAGNFQDYLFSLGGAVLWAARNRPFTS